MFTFFTLPMMFWEWMGAACVVYLAWALLPGFLAKNKGRSFWAFFALGLLSPLVLSVVVLCLKDRTAQAAEQAAEALSEEVTQEPSEEEASEEEVSEEEASEEEVTEEEASEEEISEEVTEEELTEEELSEEEAPEETQKPANKNAKRIVITVIAGVIAVAAICACCYFAVRLALLDASEAIFDSNGAYGQNTVTVQEAYCVAAASADDENMRTVVATDKDGNPAMTNADLQIWYWDNFGSFMQQYGSYASMFGLDISAPLSSQPSIADGMNWEQYFLDAAVQNKAANYAMAQAAYADGYVPSAEDQATIDSFSAPDGTLAQAAAEAGAASVDAYVQMYYGSGVTLETYLAYVRECLAHNYEYQKLLSEIESGVTDDALSAYYDAHAEEMAAERILKVNNVSVRHILIAPEGAKDETTGDYPAQAWTDAEAKANEIYALWQEDATEENFIALANEHSTDGGSNTNGGLYENFTTADMVEEFSDWSFDQSRQYGDSAIVKTDYGYHIMFFVEQTDTQGWAEPTKEKLVSTQLNERIDEMIAQYPLQFDFSKIRLFDWLTFAMNENAATEETAG